MLSFQEDSWLQEKYESSARWIASLSNGETVYEDDDRPNVSPRSAWVRLKEYCDINHLFVKSLVIQFRSHRELVYNSEGEGIYFCKGMIGHWGGPNVHYYVVGVLENGVLTIKKWRTPEVIPIEEEVRELDDKKEKLIIKKI